MGASNLRKAIAFVLVLAWSFIFTSESHCDWIDEWISNANYGGYTPGSHGVSQGRGYASFGSFNMRRTTTTSDYLFNIEAPRVSAGCSGVDLFLGGVGYVQDPSLLMAKARGIISAAPYVAFEMALNFLNESLGSTWKNIESMINALNNININDCATAKTMVTSLVDSKSNSTNQAMTAWQEWAQSSGFGEVRSSLNTLMDRKTLDGAASGLMSAFGQTQNPITATCPTELKAITDTRSLLQTLLSRRGYSSDTIDVIRGFYGDFDVTPEKVTYIDGCPANEEGKILEVFYNGLGQKKNSAGQCILMSNSVTINGQPYTSLENWAETMLIEIRDHLRNFTALSAENRFFIEHTPAPVYLHLKNAMMTGGSDVGIDSYKKLCAKGFVFITMSDFVGALSENISKANRILSAQANGDKQGCNPASLGALATELKNMKDLAIMSYEKANTEYMTALSEFGSHATNASQVQALNEIVLSNVGRAFGTSLAQRLGGAL